MENSPKGGEPNREEQLFEARPVDLDTKAFLEQYMSTPLEQYMPNPNDVPVVPDELQEVLDKTEWQSETNEANPHPEDKAVPPPDGPPAGPIVERPDQHPDA
jgi:hypothetical protein